MNSTTHPERDANVVAPTPEALTMGAIVQDRYRSSDTWQLASKPLSLTFEQAAAVPISATTAVQGLRLGRIDAGQHVLVIGASGGAGTYATEVGKASYDVRRGRSRTLDSAL